MFSDFPTLKEALGFSIQRRRQINPQIMNCSELLTGRYLPTSSEAFEVLGNLGTVLVATGAVSVSFVFLLFIQESYKLARYWSIKSYLLTWACLSVFPVTCLCLYVNILLPKASDYTNPIVLLHLPVPLIFFYELVVSYAGGETKLLQSLLGETLNLQGPPVCCICWFLPKLPLTRRKFIIIKFCIYQLLCFHLIVFILTQVTDQLGFYRMGELNMESAAPYLLFLNALSFFAGVYGIVVFTRLCAAAFPGYYLRSKFIVLQTNFLLVRVHFFAFDFFGRLGALPCEPPLSSFAVAQYLKSSLLLTECLILAVLARIFFLQPPPSPLEDQVPAVQSIQEPEQ